MLAQLSTHIASVNRLLDLSGAYPLSASAATGEVACGHVAHAHGDARCHSIGFVAPADPCDALELLAGQEGLGFIGFRARQQTHVML